MPTLWRMAASSSATSTRPRTGVSGGPGFVRVDSGMRGRPRLYRGWAGRNLPAPAAILSRKRDSTMKRNTLVGMSPRELQELAVAHGQPRYRGRQLAQWIYGRRIASLRDATNLPRALREELDAAYGLPRLEPVERSVSPDGTAKLLFELHDGARIESVAMPRP